jgi:hypothetical protein
MWIYSPPDEPSRVLGNYEKPDRWGGAIVHFGFTLEVAQFWARELLAGRPPIDHDCAPHSLR